MRNLIDKLNYYTKLYDAGTPAITDKEFDDLYFELVEMEKNTGIIYPDSPTQSISFEIQSNLEKVEHNHPMLSLPKSKNFEEIKNFINNRDYVAMTKCDGLTCSLRYKDGKLVSAETRGDGRIGENILANAKVMPSVPNYIPYNDELIIDGEVVCLTNDFLEFVDDYANPRNFAAGSIRLLDSKESSQRKLTFIAWEVIKGFEEVDSLAKCFAELKKLGFTVVPHLHGLVPEEEDVDIISAMSSNVPKDGIVFKFDSRSYGNSLGITGHHLGNAIAFKLYDEIYPSTLLNIVYEPSRNGVLTPVAIFEPIEIDGAIVSRCSLFNLTILKEKLGQPFIGQKIWITKRNQIIPYIEYAEDENGNKI